MRHCHYHLVTGEVTNGTVTMMMMMMMIHDDYDYEDAMIRGSMIILVVS